MDASVHTASFAVPVHFLVAKVLDAPTHQSHRQRPRGPHASDQMRLGFRRRLRDLFAGHKRPRRNRSPIVKLGVAAIVGGGLHVGGVRPEP